MWRKNLDLYQTIFALTTGNLPSAVAIVKIAGPLSFEIAGKIFQPSRSQESFSKSAGVSLGTLHDEKGQHLDDCLVLSFVSPQSHSGEDTVEFHCHGSVAIVRRLEQVLLELGARPAERGEFSYRAHLNGKMTAAELDTLGDIFTAQQVVDLSSIYQRKDGSLEKQILLLREELIKIQAIFDTAVDFSEEYSAVVSAAKNPIKQVTRGCSEIIQRYKCFKESKNLPRVVLAGKPNAGKSSLFNALLCRYRAIVHEEPGTTRDVIEEDVEINGRYWKLVDTAGVRSGTQGAEKEGLALGEEFLSASSFWILVIDGTLGISKEEELLFEKHGRKPHLTVWNKNDLSDWSMPAESVIGSGIGVSAKSGQGLAELWELLKDKLLKALPNEQGALPSSVQTHRLKVVVQKLEDLQIDLANQIPAEYLAEKNREIIGFLESVIGEVGTEDVLDRVFSEFCIGK